jgi:hypothetical protein
MKVSPKIIRPFPKDGPRKTRGKEHGKCNERHTRED